MNKTLESLIGKGKELLLKEFNDNIDSGQSIKSPIILMTNIYKVDTVYTNPDVLVGFGDMGECVIVTERIRRVDYTLVAWIKALAEGFKSYMFYNKLEGYRASFTFTKKNAQITIMKREWCDKCLSGKRLIRLG